MKRILSIANHNLTGLACMLMLLTTSGTWAMNDNLMRVASLEGSWKFSIGERDEWLELRYNDSDWEIVQVPAAWEDQGFYGYNGMATYRKTFSMNSSLQDKNLYLVLGYIDDVDETFFNGHKIGSTGSFPPNYVSAYNAKREYYIPEEYINFGGDNVVTVVVYDSYQYGGIVKGDIGIYTNPNEVPVELNLQGTWKFKTGDGLDRKEPGYVDLMWEDIFVPAKWEDQGHRNYDGYAWYRKTFTYRGIPTDSKLVLFLGRIDDIDEVYINGVKIGSTGPFSNEAYARINTETRYRELRGYYFDPSLLKRNQPNTIAVRVYDSGGEGGIYEGPVGIISQTKYIKFWRDRSRRY